MSGTWCLVVPSIRGVSFRRFVKEWSDVGLFDDISGFILVEDNPTKTFDVDVSLFPSSLFFRHVSWEEIAGRLKTDQWIIPRRSDTVRSYGYYAAYTAEQTFDNILTLDDDCYPDSGAHSLLVAGHEHALYRRERWVSTLKQTRPRGLPYRDRGSLPTYVNHGLWTKVPDLDAINQLSAAPGTDHRDYPGENVLVPAGTYFPMCGMNLAWRREATPLMYHMLMGSLVKPTEIAVSTDDLQRLDLDRFGDIWCGVVMKKICDHIGWPVSTGTPYISHDRASDPFVNLRKEAHGVGLNEQFWRMIHSVWLPPDSDHDVADLYAVVGRAVQQNGAARGADDPYRSYFIDLGRAMELWAGLFRR